MAWTGQLQGIGSSSLSMLLTHAMISDLLTMSFRGQRGCFQAALISTMMRHTVLYIHVEGGLQVRSMLQQVLVFLSELTGCTWTLEAQSLAVYLHQVHSTESRLNAFMGALGSKVCRERAQAWNAYGDSEVLLGILGDLRVPVRQAMRLKLETLIANDDDGYAMGGDEEESESPRFERNICHGADEDQKLDDKTTVQDPSACDSVSSCTSWCLSLVIWNLPSRFSNSDLLELFIGIDTGANFFYRPYKHAKTRLGFCLLNFISPDHAAAFMARWHCAYLPNHGKTKNLVVRPASQQGLLALLATFQARDIHRMLKKQCAPCFLEGNRVLSLSESLTLIRDQAPEFLQ